MDFYSTPFPSSETTWYTTMNQEGLTKYTSSIVVKRAYNAYRYQVIS